MAGCVTPQLQIEFEAIIIGEHDTKIIFKSAYIKNNIYIYFSYAHMDI